MYQNGQIWGIHTCTQLDNTSSETRNHLNNFTKMAASILGVLYIVSYNEPFFISNSFAFVASQKCQTEQSSQCPRKRPFSSFSTGLTNLEINFEHSAFINICLPWIIYFACKQFWIDGKLWIWDQRELLKSCVRSPL